MTNLTHEHMALVSFNRLRLVGRANRKALEYSTAEVTARWCTFEGTAQLLHAYCTRAVEYLLGYYLCMKCKHSIVLPYHSTPVAPADDAGHIHLLLCRSKKMGECLGKIEQFRYRKKNFDPINEQ